MNAPVVLVVWLALLGSSSATQPQETALAQEKAAKIEAAIADFMARQHTPAVSVAIVQDNQIRFARAYGFSDLENRVPATASTAFRIASVTKPLTAVAAMQLAESGKLDLDAPVQKYVPDFPAKPFPVTTRGLLSHTSGIRGYKRAEGERTVHYESLTDALAIFKDDPLESEPGTTYLYSTYGYTLLGAVIEGASGMSFADYMSQNIFKPAGMQSTQVDDIYAIIPNRARGYSPREYARFNGNWRNPVLMDSSYKIPGGGLVSTAEDVARFAIALQSGMLLKPQTFKQMTVNQKTRDGNEIGYGYGWYVGTREGRGADGSVWHGGVQPGFTAELWLLPDRQFAVVILTNLEGGDRLGLAPLANQLADIVLNQ